jgi:hypothetical protein
MAASTEICYIPLPECLGEENVVEGTFIKEDNRVEMFRFNRIYFAVFGNVEE